MKFVFYSRLKNDPGPWSLMTRPKSFFLFSIFLGILSGCAKSAGPTATNNPFEGTYKVTSYNRNEKDCNSTGAPVSDGPKFFKLTEETSFNRTILAYRSCTDANTCDVDLNLYASFTNEGNGWMRRIKSTTPRGTDRCELQLVEGPLVKTERGFVLEWKGFERTINLGPGEECNPDIVDKHRSELMCIGRQELVAEKQ
jgi:hypothetical protein